MIFWEDLKRCFNQLKNRWFRSHCSKYYYLHTSPLEILMCVSGSGWGGATVVTFYQSGARMRHGKTWVLVDPTLQSTNLRLRLHSISLKYALALIPKQQSYQISRFLHKTCFYIFAHFKRNVTNVRRRRWRRRQGPGQSFFVRSML